ncbi:unnamed protein product [Protopolystoma xenopodis]|uniref:Uncharacterized protein n=1 Tax=Protopolystoma xenopodis TaxID=117903 RepID=A0A448XQ68_9PLAT|nr:unnamed protein product [Protopolystoma xenopodis]
MARLTDDADYDDFICLFDEFVSWCGEWQGSLMMPTTSLVRRMAKLTDDADYDAGENEFVAWCGEWQNSLMMPTTMPAKRLRMYQENGKTH